MTEQSKTIASQIVDVATERYEFGVGEDGDPYGIPLPGGHVVRPLRGGRTSLRAELAAAYLGTFGKVVGQQPLADAMLAIEGSARDKDPEPVHIRVAEQDGVVWIDLGDADEHAVRVDADGWQVVSTGVPVLFRRTALTAPLPVPEVGGSIDELWPLLNVARDDRPLVLAWLVAALGDPDVPHPVLALLGEQGTGKSTACRTVVQLVDPSPVPLRKPPRDAEGWVTAAAGSWVVGLDNLSTIPDWLSDTLCRAVTGDGDVRRTLYSDAGLSVFAFRRALVLNGIDIGALNSDLADRAIIVNLDVIPERARRTERQLAAAWQTAWPRIFGALLTEVVGVLRHRASVTMDTSPRMADFALDVATLDKIHGTNALERYADQARTMAAETLTANTFLASLLDKITEPWAGTAGELRSKITPDEDGWRPPRGWPASARAATGLLRRNAPALRRVGWSIEDHLDGHSKTIRWHLAPPSHVGVRETTPATPAHPQSGGPPAETVAGVEAGARASIPATPATNPHGIDDTRSVSPGQKPAAGVAGIAGYESTTSHPDPTSCPQCGEPLNGPGSLSRCRSNHRPEAGAA